MLRLTDLSLQDSTSLPLLELALGQIHVVLGGNNSGKTPLCRLLAGLPGPATGRVEFDGEFWHDLSPRQRSVGFVYQAFVNYPHWTVFQNLASSCVASGLSTQETKRRIHAVAEQLELTDLLARHPAELSGGQQQRVAIGRALVKQAKLLVMDEPLVNLDYKLRESLEIELLRILREMEVTVVYTTTDPTHAIGLGDNLVVLHDRQVIQVGPPLQVYQQPNSRLCADLLSEPAVNLIPSAGRQDSQRVQRLIRPEHLRLASQASRSADSEQFTLDLGDPVGVETSGDETFVRGTMQGETWSARLTGVHNFDDTQRVQLEASTADILCLPIAEHTVLG